MSDTLVPPREDDAPITTSQQRTAVDDATASFVEDKGDARIGKTPIMHAMDKTEAVDIDTPEDWAAWRAAQAASNTRAS